MHICTYTYAPWCLFQTLQRLQKETFPHLSGTDLDMLLLYYSIVQDCILHGATSEVSCSHMYLKHCVYTVLGICSIRY